MKIPQPLFVTKSTRVSIQSLSFVAQHISLKVKGYRDTTRSGMSKSVVMYGLGVGLTPLQMHHRRKWLNLNALLIEVHTNKP